MPTVPLVVANERIGGQNFPAGTEETYGLPIGQAISDVGVLFGKIQHGEDIAETERLVNEGGEILNEIRQRNKLSITDPDTFKQTTLDQSQTAYDDVLSRASNSRVKRTVQARLTDNFIRNRRITELDYYGKKKDKGRADLDMSLDYMTKDAAAALSDVSRNAIYKEAGELVGQMRQAGYLSEKEMVDAIQAFDKKVLTSRANALILTNPAAFLNASDLTNPQNDYRRLGDDQVLELQAKAAKKIEQDEKQTERVHKQVSERIENGWYAAAYSGNLEKYAGNDLTEALQNRHPYITPKKAAELVKINEDPLTGASDNTGVSAIMQDYHSGPSSFGRINKARTELKKLGIQNKMIDRAFNELQTDERTMIGIGAAQLNRNMQAAVDEYEANKEPKVPFLSGIVPNTDTQDRAKVRDAVRRGKDPEKAAKQKTDEQKKRKDNLPDDLKTMRDILGQ